MAKWSLGIRISYTGTIRMGVFCMMVTQTDWAAEMGVREMGIRAGLDKSHDLVS